MFSIILKHQHSINLMDFVQRNLMWKVILLLLIQLLRPMEVLLVIWLFSLKLVLPLLRRSNWSVHLHSSLRLTILKSQLGTAIIAQSYSTEEDYKKTLSLIINRGCCRAVLLKLLSSTGSILILQPITRRPPSMLTLISHH